MANTVLPTAIAKFLAGDLDWTAGTWGVVLVSNAYTYDPGDEFLDDISPSVRVGSEAITGRTINGAVAEGDSVQVACTPGEEVIGFFVYRDTGVESTSELLGWVDTDDALAPISITTTAADVLVNWSTIVGGVFSL